VFAGDRVDEFAAKLRGKSYQEIQAEGGGILSTVRAVREASLEELTRNLLDHLDVMLAHGTTTAEVKSGYGLPSSRSGGYSRRFGRRTSDIPSTWYRRSSAPTPSPRGPTRTRTSTKSWTNRSRPSRTPIRRVLRRLLRRGRVHPRAVATRPEAGLDHGLAPKIHAEEFERLGGAQLAADLGAVSADHLLQATPDDAAAMAEAGVTPVLLPGTAFTLGTDYADPTLFEDAGSRVALATDFNPNCYSQSMEFANGPGVQRDADDADRRAARSDETRRRGAGDGRRHGDAPGGRAW